MGAVSSPHRVRGDRGQVVPLVAGLIVVVAGIGVLVVAVGGVLLDRAQARTAADASALAAAAGSDADAAEVASANGAELVRVERAGDAVEVEVRRGRATARARAETVRGVVPPAPRRPGAGCSSGCASSPGVRP